MRDSDKMRRVAFFPEDYNRIRCGSYAGETLNGIDLERYDNIIDEMLQEHGLTRHGYEIATAPGAKIVHTDLQQLLQDAQKKFVAERDQRFCAAENQMREYKEQHKELDGYCVDWSEIEREDHADIYWVSLWSGDPDDPDFDGVIVYNMECGTVRVEL